RPPCPLPLHDALPIFAFEVPPGYEIVNTPTAVLGRAKSGLMKFDVAQVPEGRNVAAYLANDWARELGAGRLANVSESRVDGMPRSEEHTSELQSRENL